MSEILNLILSGEKPSTIETKIADGAKKISLFKVRRKLKNKSLFEYLIEYKNLKEWTLTELIELGAIDIEETDNKQNTVIQRFIIENELEIVKMLLSKGAELHKQDDKLTNNEEMLSFLHYKPGQDQPRIIDFCCRPKTREYNNKIQQLLLDYEDSSDEESSEEENLKVEMLSQDDEKAAKKFMNAELKEFEKNGSADGLCIMVARGVHFSPRYFSSQMINDVKKNKNKKHPTFSQSTLFDSGYKADTEVNEEDKKIIATHNKNVKFIKDIKEKKDKKEVRLKNSVPKSRNDRQFENLYYRFMQAYIMSYNRVINLGSIKTDFGFYSNNNPEISTSFYTEKSAMYASGGRFSWDFKVRRNPHYRRFTGVPKHPNLGYVDFYEFPIEYVRENGADRQLMFKNEQIGLSAMFKSEGEIIFHSMIPSKFHVKRFIITLPSFEEGHAKIDRIRYGLLPAKYKQLKDQIHNLPANMSSESFKTCISEITEKTSIAQAKIIEKTARYFLFNNKQPKVIVYDHGDSLETQPLKI